MIAQSYGAPSDLCDVLDQIAGKNGTIEAAGYSVPVLIGKRYLEQFGVGSDPRVIFIPEPRGKIGPPIGAGNAASVTSSCDFAIRGPEQGDDIFRFRATYNLIKVVISAIARATSGRREWGDLADDSPLNVDGLGADLKSSFTYQWDVRWDQAIVSVGAAPADTSEQSPSGPVKGQQAPAIGAIDVTTTPKEQE